MTIQRQYSLPNCQLVVEGVSRDAALDDIRPLLSMVTHVECRFPGQEKPLRGGRDLLEQLATAVSEYAQEYLSGIQHPQAHAHRGKPRLVQFQKVDTNLHRLTVQPSVNNDTQSDATITPGQLDLTTVQFFDLVEAVDQLYADAQTVPELALKLTPLPKRLAVSQEPIARRAAAPALGLSSLALAAAAFFFIPVPRPAPQPNPQSSAEESSTVAAAPTTASPGPAAGASPNPNPSPSPAASPSPITSPIAANSTTTDSSPTSSPTTSPVATASPSVPNREELGAILDAAPAITEPTELDRLTASLQEDLYSAWQEKPAPTFTKDLEYRVGVAKNGDILGYKFINDEALNFVSEIPLSDLQYQPTGAPGTNREPIAQFRVVFTPDGILEISPWHGDPTAAPAPTPGSTP